MKTPRKAVVTKRISEDEKLNAARWSAFIVASGTPVNELTDEWYTFFDKQADVETASVELVKLVDKAIAKDMENIR